MKRIGSALAVLVALAIIAIAIGGLAYGVIEDPAVVGPLAAAAVAIGVAVFQRRWEKSQELERLHRDEMAPIYERLIETVKTIDEFAQKPAEEQQAFFRATSTALLLHGPSPVVRAWVAWNQLLGVQPVSVPIRAQENLLRAIREDLGHDNSSLQPGELLRLYLNEEDTDEDRALWREIREGA
jgi:hypothetical protein